MDLPFSADHKPPASESARSPEPLAAPPPRRSRTVPLRHAHNLSAGDRSKFGSPIPPLPDMILPLPVAPLDMFFTLSPYTAQPIRTTTANDSQLPQILVGSPSPGPSVPLNHYDLAVSRIKGLTDYLTPVMRASLIATLSVVHALNTPPGIHPLIIQIGSTMFSDSALKEVADIVMAGLSAYEAKGGVEKGSTPASRVQANDEVTEPPKKKLKSAKTNSSARKGTVRTKCALRDDGICAFTHLRDGQICHIIPFAVQDKKAVDFWKFISLFRGPAATAALKAATLGPYPHSTDTLLNMLVMMPDVHRHFDRAKVALIPQLTCDQLPFDPQHVSTVRTAPTLLHDPADFPTSMTQWSSSRSDTVGSGFPCGATVTTTRMTI